MHSNSRLFVIAGNTPVRVPLALAVDELRALVVNPALGDAGAA